MSATLPRIVPTAVVAGDSVQFDRPGGDYTASDGWSRHFAVVGQNGAYAFDATASGDDFAISVPATTTAGWVPGDYVITEYVTNAAGERHTIGSQALVIRADLATVAGAGTATDTRSYARQMLDTIEAYLKTKDPGAADVSINGRRITYYTVPDLLVLRDKFKAEVNAEQRLASGRRPRIVARL